MTFVQRAVPARYVGDTGFDAVASSALAGDDQSRPAPSRPSPARRTPRPGARPVTPAPAAVSVVAPGSGTPTGLVTFFNGPATLGAAGRRVALTASA